MITMARSNDGGTWQSSFIVASLHVRIRASPPARAGRAQAPRSQKLSVPLIVIGTVMKR
jgi:hypothetical protein